MVSDHYFSQMMGLVGVGQVDMDLFTDGGYNTVKGARGVSQKS